MELRTLAGIFDPRVLRLLISASIGSDSTGFAVTYFAFPSRQSWMLEVLSPSGDDV